jgi:hypothetical protein
MPSRRQSRQTASLYRAKLFSPYFGVDRFTGLAAPSIPILIRLKTLDIAARAIFCQAFGLAARGLMGLAAFVPTVFLQIFARC